MNSNTPITCLGGTLVRVAPNQYQWSDGSPEPRCADLTLSAYYNFRCRAYGDGTTYVEVPLSVAYREPLLCWVIEGVKSGKYRQSHSGDHTGPRVIKGGSFSRMRIEPGEDPLHGNEPIVHKRATPRVALVPAQEWDERSAQCPCGVIWDRSEQDEIFARARSLGWQQ